MPSNGQGRNLAQIVGSNIRAARAERDWSQRELALRVAAVPPKGKTDSQQISDWERGVNRPSETSLQRLAAVLGQDVSWFFVDRADEKAAA